MNYFYFSISHSQLFINSLTNSHFYYFSYYVAYATEQKTEKYT